MLNGLARGCSLQKRQVSCTTTNVHSSYKMYVQHCLHEGWCEDAEEPIGIVSMHLDAQAKAHAEARTLHNKLPYGAPQKVLYARFLGPSDCLESQPYAP